MKQYIARSEELIAEHNRMIATPNEACGVVAPPIAHQLRALGQVLEKFSFSAFDLELRSGTYLVTGHAVSAEEVKFSFAGFLRGLLRGSPVRTTVSGSSNPVEL